MSELSDLLTRCVGTWDGTYTHLDAASEIVDQYQSTQRIRLNGDQWYEQITYRPGTVDERVIDFQATLSAGGLSFDDDDFDGTATAIGSDTLVLPYRWRSKPKEFTVETVMLPAADVKLRNWLVCKDGELSESVLIIERRRAT